MPFITPVNIGPIRIYCTIVVFIFYSSFFSFHHSQEGGVNFQITMHLVITTLHLSKNILYYISQTLDVGYILPHTRL